MVISGGQRGAKSIYPSIIEMIKFREMNGLKQID